MEEQKNNLLCKYLGCTLVEKPGGMNILRPTIEKIAMTIPEDKWIPVIVKISPTSIVVCSDDVRRFLFSKEKDTFYFVVFVSQ